MNKPWGTKTFKELTDEDPHWCHHCKLRHLIPPKRPCSEDIRESANKNTIIHYIDMKSYEKDQSEAENYKECSQDIDAPIGYGEFKTYIPSSF